MGNTIGLRPSDTAGVTGKVILSDGGVQEYDETTTVAELMLEHPQHVVVEFDPSSISISDSHRKNTEIVKTRLTPLPADKILEPGKIYLMLPAKRRTAAASAASEEVRRILSSAAAVMRTSRSYYEGIIPWFARVFPVGGREVTVAVEKMAAPAVEVMEEEGEEWVRPEYLSRQLSGRGWKPSLDTIKEKKVKRKVNYHRLLF